MKKLAVLTAFLSISLAASAQQTSYDIYSGKRKSTVINGFVSTLSPVVPLPKDGQKKGGALKGVSISYSSPVVGATFQFGYIRDGITNIIYTETGDGTTFAMENGSVGEYLLLPTDTLYATSSDATPAQITLLYWED